MAITVVTDRTKEDATAMNEKGTYRVADYNRVEGNTKIIADLLSDVGYYTTVQTKTDWVKEDLFEYSDMNDRYLGNVKKCVSQFAVKKDTETLPETIDRLTYNKANAIEKSLQDIEILVGNMKKEYRYAGTFFAGRSIYDDVELEFLKKSIYDTANVSTDIFGYLNNQINDFKNQVSNIL